MAGISINEAAIKELKKHPAIIKQMEQLGQEILTDAQDNIRSMNAYVTGNLHDSGFVDADADGVTIGFDAHYASYVHEGEGTSSGIGPRPFLAQAAAKERTI